MAFFRKEGALKTAEKLVSKGKIEAAIKEYKKVLDKDREDTNTLNRIGDLYARLRKNDEAIGYYTQTADKYASDGFYVKAIAVFKKVHRLDPSRIDVHLRLAELYQRQGLVNDARGHFQQVADHYLRASDAAAAIGVLQKMAALEPSNPTVHLKLAELYRAQGLLDRSLEEYASIAQLMISHAQVDQAVQVYRRAFEVDPTNLDYIRTAVAAVEEAGRSQAAGQLLEAAVVLNPQAASLRPSGSVPTPAASMSPTSSVELGGVTFETETESDPAVGMPPDDSLQTAVGLAPIHEADAFAPATGQEPSGHPTELPALSSVDTFELPDPSLDSSELPSLLDADAGEAAGLPGLELPTAADLASEELGDPAPSLDRAAEEEYERFVLDWESDETPPTQVQPPEDAPLAPPVATPTPSPVPLAAAPPVMEPPPSSSPLASDGGLGGGGEFELELDNLESSVRELAQSSGASSDSGEWAFGPEPELEAVDLSAKLASPAAQPESAEPEESAPQTKPRGTAEDLLAEAEVFVKYGLIEKATDRLSEVLELAPQHVGAHARLIRILVEQGRFERVPVLSAALVRLAQSIGHIEVWNGVKSELAMAGVELDGERIVGLPDGAAVALPQAETQPDLLGEVDLSVSEDELGASEVGTLGMDDFGQGSEIEAGEPLLEVGAPTELPAVEMSDPGADKLVDSLALGALEPEPEEPVLELRAMLDDPPSTPVLQPELEGSAAGDFSPEAFPESAEWLRPELPKIEPDEPLFDDAGESEFDLGAELRDELGEVDHEPEMSAAAAGESHEQSLEEIVEGFKKGVAENLSPEDSDTHYNLGIAYREMMLLDEAIGEFQVASRSEEYRVDSCTMLGLCFREQGLVDLAIKSYRQALEVDSASAEQRWGVLYELGITYEEQGERGDAYDAFLEIYGGNSNYRDVASKIKELAPSSAAG